MLITTLCVTLVCILATNFVAYNIFKTERSDKNGFTYAVFGTAIARVVAENGNITDEQMQRIEKNVATKSFIMANYSETKPYTLVWAQETNDPEGFFKDKTHEVYNNFFVVNMAQNKGEVIKLYFELLPENFGIMTDNVLVSTLSLWSSCDYENVERDVFKITGFSFYSHIFQLLILIAASLILLKKGRKKYFWLLAIPVLANSVSIAISAVTNEVRYLQPMALLFGPIMLQMVVWARQDNKVSCETSSQSDAKVIPIDETDNLAEAEII
jgi:hypothetical protein